MNASDRPHAVLAATNQSTNIRDPQMKIYMLSPHIICHPLKEDRQNEGSVLSAVNFYRATLCIARTMLSQDVCPSVRHTPVLCMSKTAKQIIRLYHLWVAKPATPFKFFYTKRGGDSLMEERMQGVSRFSTNISNCLRNDKR